MNLPQAFAERMRRMLGDEYEAFVAAYDRPNTPALRLNPAKCKSPEPLLPKRFEKTTERTIIVRRG